ncbi:MAG TPA: hypothetical protein VKU90_16040 [Caulobacteraceae bacterium]|nr:hypothetical protein [Caulobacteraceae bacterium]
MAADRTKTPFRRWAALAMVAAIGLAGAAAARADPVDLQVVDRDTGRPLRIWRHDGHLFVAGEPGERYSLRVANHTGGRVLLVMSVDGVNIYTGETASYDQSGYVLDAYQSYDVTGWRKSTTQVAAFSFAPLPDSYAARTGRPVDVGVIGMAVFTERVIPPETYAAPPEREQEPTDESDRMSSRAGRRGNFAPPVVTPMTIAPPPPALAQSAPKAGLAGPPADSVAIESERRDERLGTAHGAREWSVVHLVDFERATSYPQWVRQIEYDTRAHLLARGVIPTLRDDGRQPNPFPSDSEGFVPDPPG